MGREKPDYRDNLELLNSMYPDKAMLSVAEVKTLTGWRDTRTVQKHLRITAGVVSKVAVARMMCQ